MLQENWSAFAPDFKELEENVEYDERESEFDLEDEDKEKVDMKGPDEEDLEVDVTTVEPIQAFVSRWVAGRTYPGLCLKHRAEDIELALGFARVMAKGRHWPPCFGSQTRFW